MSWREVELGDVLTLQRGYDLPTRKRRPGDVPVVSSSGISGYHDEAKVRGPGVVTGRYGTLGEVYFIEGDFWPHNTTLFVRDFHGNDRRFAYHLLSGLDLVNRSAVSAVPGVNRNDLHRLPVKLPPLPIQHRIADILGALDDKIELNRRMNRTLEAMAQALYKHWFVDFGPFQDGEFVDSELGLIPSGWKVKAWGELATLEYGKRLSGYRDSDGPYPVFGTNGQIGWHSTPLCPHPGVIIGRKGAYREVRFSEKPFYVIDTAFYLNPLAEMEIRWAYYTISRYDINSMDSGSAIPSTSRDAFYRLIDFYPPIEVQKKFTEWANPLWKQQSANEAESRILTETRDYLLPKLLSGEIEVEAAEELVEAAV